MTSQPRYSQEEQARLGTELYEREIRARVEPENEGKIVAIDVDSGEYEIAEDTIEACARLRDRLPDAQPWVIRIGHEAVHRFGSRIGNISRSDRDWPTLSPARGGSV